MQNTQTSDFFCIQRLYFSTEYPPCKAENKWSISESKRECFVTIINLSDICKNCLRFRVNKRARSKANTAISAVNTCKSAWQVKHTDSCLRIENGPYCDIYSYLRQKCMVQLFVVSMAPYVKGCGLVNKKMVVLWQLSDSMMLFLFYYQSGLRLKQVLAAFSFRCDCHRLS